MVSFYPEDGLGSDQADGHLNVRLVLRSTIPHPDLSYLFDGDGGRASSCVRLKLGDYNDGSELRYSESNYVTAVPPTTMLPSTIIRE